MQDELDDDALSDGGDEEISEQDQGASFRTPISRVRFTLPAASLDDAFEKVVAVIGNATATGLSDRDVKNVIWDNYFGVESTIEWALGVW